MPIDLCIVYHPVACAAIRQDGRTVDSAHPLRLVRGLLNSLRFRFEDGTGAPDAAVAPTDFARGYAAVVLDNRTLALTETGFSAAADTDGATVVTLDDLPVNTKAVADSESRLFPVRTGSTASENSEEILNPRGCRAELEVAGYPAASSKYPTVRLRIPILIQPLLYQPPVPELPEIARYCTRAEVDSLLAALPSPPPAIQRAVRAAEPDIAFDPDVAIYTRTVAEGDAFTFDSSALAPGFCFTFELHLTMPDPAVSFTFPDGLIWLDGEAPDLGTGGKCFWIVIRRLGGAWYANLAAEVAL